MLTLHIKPTEVFNEQTSEFETVKSEAVLNIEHSLISISKWESEKEKPFLESFKDFTPNDLRDYIFYMTVDAKRVDQNVYLAITDRQLADVALYLNAKKTATTFHENPNDKWRRNRQIITSELIYYWMIESGIPFECQKWHINRLLTLIQVCSNKQQQQLGGGKKMSKRDIYARNRQLNEQRRALLGTKG